MFNLLTKVYQPTRGTILLNGKDTHGMSTAQVNRAGIARTFQNIRLFSKLSVLDNVLIAKHMRAKQNVFSATFRLNHAEEKRMREESLALLEEQNLLHLKDEIAGSLPTACSATWRSPGPWPPSPSSCCWTSPPRA